MSRIFRVCITTLAIGAALTVPTHVATAAVDSPITSASSIAVWTPPDGYVYEAAWFGTAAYCESQGKKGVAEGRWTDYLCHAELRQGADIPLLFHVLYVKK